MSILKVHAREIFDSRGNPTVEVDLYTNKGESVAVGVYCFLASDKLRRQSKVYKLCCSSSGIMLALHTCNMLLSLLWELQEKPTSFYWDEFAEL